jgi:hypothetical protein
LLNENNENCTELQQQHTKSDNLEFGEDYAIELIKDYIKLGETSFGLKYCSRYMSLLANSEAHAKSLQRLVLLKKSKIFENSKVMNKNKFLKKQQIINSSNTISNYFKLEDENEIQNINFFDGEILSGLLRHCVEVGSISPRVVYHARKTLFSGLEGFFAIQRPYFCHLRDDITRHDWHSSLAFFSKSKCFKDNENNSFILHSNNVIENKKIEINNDDKIFVETSNDNNDSKKIEKNYSSVKDSDNKDGKNWNFKFRKFRGYIQRDAEMINKNVFYLFYFYFSKHSLNVFIF